MALKTWIGGTDTDFGVAGNWSASGVPADGDSLLFNHLAQRDCLLNLTQAAKAFVTVTATTGFVKNLGASGAAFKPANGITTLNWNASAGQCYIDCGIVNVIMDATNVSSTALVLDNAAAGDIANITLKNGYITMAATAIADDPYNWLVEGGTLRINAGTSLTGTAGKLVCNGGLIDCDANADTIVMRGGTVNLGETATLTLAELYGGRFQWESSGTITTVKLFDGAQFIITADVPKTLTTGHAYGGVADLSRGTQLTETNGWYWNGRPTILYGPGALVKKS